MPDGHTQAASRYIDLEEQAIPCPIPRAPVVNPGNLEAGFNGLNRVS